MSHEGIRIVDEREARRIAPHKLPHEAVDPAKVRIHKSEGTGMEIDWKDGHRSAWTFRWLRDACPCATCHEAREATGLEPGERKPASGRSSCRCMKHRRGPIASSRRATTLSSSSGTTATPAAFIRGISCAATASARNAASFAPDLYGLGRRFLRKWCSMSGRNSISSEPIMPSAVTVSAPMVVFSKPPSCEG